jgi:hypothetical protein
MSQQAATASKQAPLPKPETNPAWLVSDGFDKPTYTRHYYFETRALPQAIDALGRQVQEYEYVYQCSRTGALRRYGTTCVLLDGSAYSEDSTDGVEAVN